MTFRPWARFATYAGGEGPAVIYETKLVPPIAPDAVRERYGESASARARQDRDSVVLRLSRIGGG